MILDNNQIEKLIAIVDSAPKNIVLFVHYNPDGDAVGSASCLCSLLKKSGHAVNIIAPNNFPDFMNWIPGSEDIIIYRDKAQLASEIISKADVMVLMDFNQTNRLEDLETPILANTTAARVLIDHHLMPPPVFDVTFSFPESCSTSYLLYRIIVEMGRGADIDCDMATCLYTGIMTDTGNFSFSNLTPSLFRCVADLMEKGINIPEINRQVYNTFSKDRIRLMGFCLNDKMVIKEEYNVAYISLSEREMRRYNFRQGDSEGFVNIPLSIGGMLMSAMFTEARNAIRISLRSRGDIDVNLFARKYFNGGGHKNAAGARSTDSLLKTIDRFEKGLAEFFAEKN